MNQTGIQSSFDSTLKDTNFQDIAIDFVELTIDQLLVDGLLKDIPIVNTLTSLAKGVSSIQDRLFLKKILTFLNGLKEVSPQKRHEMVEKIDNSKEYRTKVGEKLLYIIDTCNDSETSELIGILFKALLEEKIYYNEFLKASIVIQRISIDDFQEFNRMTQRSVYDLADIGSLAQSGLFDIYYDEINVSVEDRQPFTTNTPTKSFETDVDGGTFARISHAGKIILKVFKPGTGTK